MPTTLQGLGIVLIIGGALVGAFVDALLAPCVVLTLIGLACLRFGRT